MLYLYNLTRNTSDFLKQNCASNKDYWLWLRLIEWGNNAFFFSWEPDGRSMDDCWPTNSETSQMTANPCREDVFWGRIYSECCTDLFNFLRVIDSNILVCILRHYRDTPRCFWASASCLRLMRTSLGWTCLERRLTKFFSWVNLKVDVMTHFVWPMEYESNQILWSWVMRICVEEINSTPKPFSIRMYCELSSSCKQLSLRTESKF